MVLLLQLWTNSVFVDRLNAQSKESSSVMTNGMYDGGKLCFLHALWGMTLISVVSCRVLSQMPQGPALTLLKGMNKTSMRAVRNKSAWLNSQCRRITAQARS